MNWKTTLAGVGGLLGALGGLATMIANGQIDGTMLTTDLGIISASFGAIFAKDWNVTGGTPSKPATTK